MTGTPTTVAAAHKTPLSFDLWRNDRWIGMSVGPTAAAARQVAIESLGAECMSTVIMTPFMGLGTSQETYKAITGRNCLS